MRYDPWTISLMVLWTALWSYLLIFGHWMRLAEGVHRWATNEERRGAVHASFFPSDGTSSFDDGPHIGTMNVEHNKKTENMMRTTEKPTKGTFSKGFRELDYALPRELDVEQQIRDARDQVAQVHFPLSQGLPLDRKDPFGVTTAPLDVVEVAAGEMNISRENYGTPGEEDLRCDLREKLAEELRRSLRAFLKHDLIKLLKSKGRVDKATATFLDLLDLERSRVVRSNGANGDAPITPPYGPDLIVAGEHPELGLFLLEGKDRRITLFQEERDLKRKFDLLEQQI